MGRIYRAIKKFHEDSKKDTDFVYDGVYKAIGTVAFIKSITYMESGGNKWESFLGFLLGYYFYSLGSSNAERRVSKIEKEVDDLFWKKKDKR